MKKIFGSKTEIHNTPGAGPNFYENVFYIEDLSCNFEMIYIAKHAKVGVGLTGTGGFSRFISPTNLYMLLLPLSNEQAGKKSHLFSQIERKLEELENRDRPNQENMDGDVEQDRQRDHIMGSFQADFVPRYQTLVNLFPEFRLLCEEYDRIKPELSLKPEIFMFKFPGAKEYDFKGYKKGQVIDVLPENALLL